LNLHFFEKLYDVEEVEDFDEGDEGDEERLLFGKYFLLDL
jgi:hypothetical protein